MLRLNCICLALALLCLSAASAAQADSDQTEHIRSFDSHIILNADNTMQVRETIEVWAAGDQIRHGIYREFPTRYKDLLGNRYIVAFEIGSVQRDGNSEPYHMESMSNASEFILATPTRSSLPESIVTSLPIAPAVSLAFSPTTMSFTGMSPALDGFFLSI